MSRFRMKEFAIHVNRMVYASVLWRWFEPLYIDWAWYWRVIPVSMLFMLACTISDRLNRVGES
jgi:hypothetical protein